MIENITESYLERIVALKDGARRIIDQEYTNPDASAEDLRHALGRLLLCYDFAAENLESLRLINYALINEFKSRGINPFEVTEQ